MSKQIFTIANAHLDTIWSWDLETTIREYIYHTIVDNLKLFDKYPVYRFNFEGAYRYELMEEYYPELFEKVKEKVQEGRWNVTGSAYENGDVNVPSPEALLRNFLYGNRYFKKTFGKTSADIFLPDCFGFGWALPSIARHAEIKGFSTQKLSWGSAYGVPFDLGKWVGVDGNDIYAALKMHPYDDTLQQVRSWDLVTEKLQENEPFDLPMTAVYYGTGDRGGAPKEQSARVLQKEITENDAFDTKVLSSTPDELYEALDSLPEAVKAKLPEWKDELLMSTHAVGSYVSRSISKRWNRKGEELADMAERSAVCAYLLGRDYPHKMLETCWKRIIRHQFHDDLTGTSVQRAYRRVWNDYAMSINQLVGEYEAASRYIADKLDTSWVTGTAVMVNNPCEYERKDVVEVLGSFEKEAYIAVDGEGNMAPCQKTADGLLFIAKLPPLGYRVFDIREGTAERDSSLTVGETVLENRYIRAKLNEDGWVCSVLDKTTGNELLQAPIRLALYDYEGSLHWPAWEIPNDAAIDAPHYPRFVSSEVLESGPVRARIKLEYAYQKSRFTTVLSLTENGEMLAFQNETMWHELATIAKQEFTLNASSELASFDLGLGAIRRGNRSDKLYEVPAQKWADLSDGNVNVSVISDSKYSWDKYNDNTLRLTVLHTPKRNYRIDSMQSMMDLGLNRYGFALTAHGKDDFTKTNRLAKNFHQPMPSFIVSRHGGNLGSGVSFGKLCDDNLLLRAMKKAEDSDAVILRFNEINCGERKGASFTLNADVLSATEVYASENPIGEAALTDNTLTFDISAYGIKSFCLTVNRKTDGESTQTPLPLDGNVAAYSLNSTEKKDLLPRCGLSIPAELVPQTVDAAGVRFVLHTQQKALLAKGQTVALPNGTKRVHLLCAGLDGDKNVTFGDKQYTVNAMLENYAGWDLYDYGETAFIKDGRLAFEVTHAHCAKGDEIAQSMLFWLVTVDTDGDVLTLPDDEILILAMTADTQADTCTLATALTDKVEKRPFTYQMDKDELKQYKRFKRLSKMNDKERYFSMKNK